MYKLIKKILFCFPPEYIHYRIMAIMRVVSGTAAGRQLLKHNFQYHNPALTVKIFGLTFPNPVGLAAGFDKNAKYVDELALLGFGFVEIGTLTPLPQPGNPQPRLFRLPKDKALINRMGFNNEGVKAAAARLIKRKATIIIGGNIGKNKITPNEEAIGDYEKGFEELFDVVDYFVVNVSSPNTPNLRELQEKEPLKRLLARLQELNHAHKNPKPLLLKIAPDLSQQQLDDIIEIVTELKLSGIVATNTTIQRDGLLTTKAELENIGAGGLSGLPLKARSTAVIKYIHQQTKGAVPIIASGGIFTAADAKEKLAAGASLVQVYTGFIYEGPAIVKNICKGLAAG